MGELVFRLSDIIILVTLAATWGSYMWRIKALEKKMDKHNCLIERMTRVETRLDGIDKHKEA